MSTNSHRNNHIHGHLEEKVRGIVLQRPGQRLPSERDLAQELQISRPRLRSILDSLSSEGLIERKPGSGTYAVGGDPEALGRVAVLIDDHLKLRDDPFVSHLFECLQNELQAVGARCMIERVDGPEPGYSLEDGAITLGLIGHRIIESLRPTDPPVVGLLLGPSVRPARRASIFLLDDQDAGAAAARHLIDKGCRSLFFVGRTDIPASNERLEGVKAVIAGTDVTFNFIGSHLNYAAGLKLGLKWTPPSGDGPIGIIATNDWLAVGIRTGLRRHDVGAVEPVHIVSFDGLSIASDPALDIRSLAIPIEAIARDAVMELRNLSRSSVSVGRIVRYSLAWRDVGSDGQGAGTG